MLEELACTCEGCDRALTSDDLEIEMETLGGVRHAYECPCGAVTVTVVRSERR